MKFTLFILLLTVLLSAAWYFPETKDGSEKAIQKWIDGLRKAMKDKDPKTISTFFGKGSVLRTCNKDYNRKPWYKEVGRSGDDLFDFLAHNVTDPVFYLNAAVYHPSLNDTIALMTITGIEQRFMGDMWFTSENGTLKFKFGEYLACGWGEVNCRT